MHSPDGVPGGGSRPTRRRYGGRAAALAALGVLAGLFVIASLAWPLGWDQGILAWVGSTIASGGMPYRDAWDVKGPAAYVPFALVSLTLGPQPWAYRLLDLLLLAGGAVAVYSTVRGLGHRSAAAFAAIAVILAQAGFGYWHTLQPDHWAGWLIAAAAAIAVRRSASPWLWGAAGTLVGVAALIKPHYSLFLLVPLCGAWMLNGFERRKRIGAVLLGAAAPAGAVATWFWAQGAMPQLVDSYLLYHLETRLRGLGRPRPFGPGLREAVQQLTFVLPLLPLAAVGLVRTWRQDRRVALVLSTWLGLTIASIVLQARWFLYHWAPAIPPVVVLSTAGIVGLLAGSANSERTARLVTRRAAALSLALVAAGLVGKVILQESWRFVALVSGRVTRTEFLRRYREPEVGYSAADIAPAVAAVTRNSDPDDCVLVWSDPFVNVRSGRSPPGRFASFVAIGSQTARRLRYRAEFMRALRSNQPRLILVDTLALTAGPGYGGNITRRFPDLLRLIRTRYDSLEAVGKYTVWRSREPRARPCRATGRP